MKLLSQQQATAANSITNLLQSVVPCSVLNTFREHRLSNKGAALAAYQVTTPQGSLSNTIHQSDMWQSLGNKQMIDSSHVAGL
jgi:hypothetical protein